MDSTETQATPEAMRQAIDIAKGEIEGVEALLRNMRENGALSQAEYWYLEGRLRFTRSNILNV